MPSRFRSLTVPVFGAIFFLAWASPALAAETASSELVIITEGETTEGDLYAAGVRVLIEGTVDGDLIAFAAEDVTITGEVTGSVLAVAPVVDIDGEVAGSVRVTANDLGVTGTISRDLVGAVFSAVLDPTSEVGGDVLLWALNVSAGGAIGGDLGGTQRRLELEGNVGGDVDVTVGRLTVTGPLRVEGDLGYRSGAEASGLDAAEVGGVVVHKSPVAPNIRVRALGMVARVLTIVALTTIAMLVAWGWPVRTRRAADRVSSQVFRSWGNGALLMLSPLLLGGVAALIAGLAPASASLPLLAIFVPLVLVSLGVVLILSLVAGIPAVLVIGEILGRRRWGMYGSILFGSLVVGIVWLIPVLGWLVVVLVLPIGLGAWMLSFRSEEGAPVEA